MPEPKQQEILEAIDRGIRKAQENYAKGSSSLLCWCYEYLITVSIFQSLISLPGMKDSLSIEEKVEDLLEYRRERRGRKPARTSGRSRCDLVVWSTEPRAIIEVKRWAEDYSDDTARLIKLAQKISCLEFSVLATCLFQKVSKDDNAEDMLRERVETIRLNIQNDAKRNNLRIHQEPESLRIEPLIIPIDDERKRRQKWVWCPVCFVIYDKSNRR